MRCVQLGGPHAIEGDNNAYIFPEDRLVVDPGPPTDESWDTLVAALEGEGLAVGGVERVLVTHWHGDHSGLAPRLADQSDACVSLHPDDAERVRDYSGARESRLPVLGRALERWGTPDPVVDRILQRESVGEAMSPCEVTTIADGDRIGDLTAVHTPGHTLGHLAFEAPDGVLVGDVLLPGYTPNVGGTDVRLDDPLGEYLASLGLLLDRGQNASGVDGTTAYPGHGRPFDLAERARAIVEHHERRCRRIRSVLLEREPATPWSVATELFGEMSGIHAQMGVGEAASHLAYLHREESVELVEEYPRRYTVLDPGVEFTLDLADVAEDPPR